MNMRLFQRMSKRMEEALWSSAREWRATFDALNYPVSHMDLEGKIRRCNKAMTNLLGKPFSEIIDHNCCKMMHGILAPIEECPRVRMRETHRRETLELLIGDQWFNIVADPLSDESGSLIGAVHIMSDITESKLAEEALRESESRYRNLIGTARDVIFTLSTNGTISSLNPGFETITGWSRAEWVDKPFILIVHPRDKKLTLEMYQVTLQGKTTPMFESGILTQQGEYVIGEFILTPQYEAGQVVSVLGIARDITERKRAEETLRDSEARFQELFDEAPVGYHEVDAEGRIIRINRTELEMLGYSAEEMVGQPAWEFIVEEETSQQAILTNSSSTIPSTQSLERICRRKDRTAFPVLIQRRVIRDANDRVTGIRSTVQDITELKGMGREKANLEEQLRQSQKMEAIGRLAGGIAHDFNNLLTIIKGYSQLSLMEFKESDPLRGNIEEIQKATDRASALTRQLLAFSRRQILEMKVLDINTLLKDLDKMLHRIIGEDIELVTLLANNLGRVKADPGQVEQVILNLAVNAKDAMLSGGKLTIETVNMELDESYVRTHAEVIPGRYVMLSVSDTGVGMTPEVKEQIFEPFFTTKEKGKGTGLGLSTVFGIVRQSEGNIWVYSEPGQGTTFKIYLPRVDEPLEEVGEKIVMEESPRGSETILVVEDDEDVRKLTVGILRRQGYTVLEASQGEEALLICEQHKEPIRLILVDVVMPGMSGHALAERLAPLRPEMKLLYMSGYTDNAIVHHGVLKKGTDYIQKPFTVDGLVRKAREVLDK